MFAENEFTIDLGILLKSYFSWSRIFTFGWQGICKNARKMHVVIVSFNHADLIENMGKKLKLK